MKEDEEMPPPPMTRGKRRKTSVGERSGSRDGSRDGSVVSEGRAGGVAESLRVSQGAGKSRESRENGEAGKDKGPGGETPWYAAKIGEIGNDLRALIFAEDRLTKKISKDILELAARYEAVILRQATQISRLEGRLEERREEPISEIGMTRRVGCGKSVSTHLAGGRKPESTSTYAVVLRDAVSGAASNAAATRQKVIEVGQTIGPVKVKSVRALKNGGVAVIAKSSADVQTIKTNAKTFAAAGLSVTEPRMGEPRLLIVGVPADLTDGQLVGDIVKSNLTGLATTEELAAIRVLGRLKKGSGNVDVVLDVPKKLRECLLNEGRLYVGWMSYRVREHEMVSRCYGCGSYGHLLARCTIGRLCHNCGEAGHTVDACRSPMKCRNCTLRGLPADHRVTSQQCPCYINECARKRGRVIA